MTPPEPAVSDLRVLDNLVRIDSRSLEFDLRLHSARAGRVDLGTVRGLDALRQSLLLRFMTRPRIQRPLEPPERGELEHLGHPNYGSPLWRLLGERNTPQTRTRAAALFLETLAQEPRVVGVAAPPVVKEGKGDRTVLEISAELIVRNLEEVVYLSLVFSL